MTRNLTWVGGKALIAKSQGRPVRGTRQTHHAASAPVAWLLPTVAHKLPSAGAQWFTARACTDVPWLSCNVVQQEARWTAVHRRSAADRRRQAAADRSNIPKARQIAARAHLDHCLQPQGAQRLQAIGGLPAQPRHLFLARLHRFDCLSVHLRGC